MPQGKLFIGLPAMSGIGIYFNNRLSYNSLISTDESGSKFFDVDKAIKSHGFANLISTNVNIGLFHLAVKLPSGVAFSTFINERIESDFTYPKTVLKWAWEGNATFLGRNMNFNNLGLTTNYFREYGVGMHAKIPRSPITFGIRAKMYQGIVNASTPSSMKLRIKTVQENFELSMKAKNTVVRTAGVEVLQGSSGAMVQYLISNGNRGFGIDAGIDYKMNRYYHFALAVNDLGFISWKEGIKNYEFSDTTFTYSGINLRGSSGVDQTIQDSLISRFNIDNTTTAYRTAMTSRVTGSFIYSPIAGVDIISTMTTRIIQNQPKMGYGVGIRGYLSPKLIGAASLTKLPQQWVNIGAAFTVTAGVLQIYAGADKILGYSAPNMHWAELRFGMNFVFGSGKAREKNDKAYKDFGPITEPKGVTTGTFMGQRAKVKKRDGIYTFIRPIKKPNPPKESSKVESVYHGSGAKSATSTREGMFERKSNGAPSSSGDVNQSNGTKKNIHSDSGGAQSQNGGGRNVRSASGEALKQEGGGRNVRSASGGAQKQKGGGRNVRSASGGAQKGQNKKKKIKSSSASSNKNSGGGRNVRSASGGAQDSQKAKKKIRSSSSASNKRFGGGKKGGVSASGGSNSFGNKKKKIRSSGGKISSKGKKN